MKQIQKLLDAIVKRCWNFTHCYDPIYQGMIEEVDGREFIYDGAACPASTLSHWDIYMIYYKGIFFICSENHIMFFKEEDLTDWLTGKLDEFWGLFPQDYGPIIYEQEILEMKEYFVNKKALVLLSESLYPISKINQ